ncbi:ATP-binding protein [Corynebacterium renale]|uniref:ATP-binding protein n=1 Tax=Corynebacterium renale TaxID=1724 RepID=UPI000BF70B85|nr:DUF4143 domain-containing protein [Corynebacterium renale]
MADKLLSEGLQRAGAVLIEGPKACGKTETARQQAASELRVDTDPNVDIAMGTDPNLLLMGATPRLVDEWQVQPLLWNAARHLIDDRQDVGQFIFTGSTAPSELVASHSGAGRFARLRMSTMTFWESGDSTGEVSLTEISKGNTQLAGGASKSIQDIAERMTRGGWPAGRNLPLEAAARNNRDYIRTIAEVDISTPDGVARDPMRVHALLRSLARGIGTEMTTVAMATDTGIGRETITDYLDSLGRIFISHDQPAWAASLRSRSPLRKAPKRHLADPALALAALGKKSADLLGDLPYMGQLFESQVVHDLRVYADGEVSHARLADGSEVDAIAEVNGTMMLVEIKLGHSASVVEEAAKSLLRFAEFFPDAQCLVITGGGMAYRRPDGVHVAPLTALRP